jgi:nicotinate-nucleotide adenylyltransferase
LRIGVLGGTFDPIHNGHIEMAKACMEVGGLDLVAFIPAGAPWMKIGQVLAKAQHRNKMTQLAVEGDSRFEVWDLEIGKGDLTFTVDTLEAIGKKRGGGDEYFLLVGADTLERFAEWKKPERILMLASLIVVPRNGLSQGEPRLISSHTFKNPEGLIWAKRPVSDISSTEIRHRVAHALPIDHLVPTNVAKYILQQRLYTEGTVPS